MAGVGAAVGAGLEVDVFVAVGVSDGFLDTGCRISLPRLRADDDRDKPSLLNRVLCSPLPNSCGSCRS